MPGKSIRNLFLNDTFILSIILVNTVTIFSEGFHNLPESLFILIYFIDSAITLLFIFEAIVKIQYWGWKKYIKSNWNKLDFILVVLSLPSFVLVFMHVSHSDLSFLLVLRVSRVFKFLRFFKFIPGIMDLAKGVKRALKTSVVVLLGFLVYNLIISVLSCSLFSDISPKYFGDPATSFYSTFRIFTVEGWYEIPERMLNPEMSSMEVFGIKIYFMFILITGGIFGLSLVNSIFVDAMISDNTDQLEDKIDTLNQKLDSLLQMETHFLDEKDKFSNKKEIE